MLQDSEATRKLGYPPFTLELRVVLRDGALETDVKVTAGPEALSFTDVLHTYFTYRGEPLVGFGDLRVRRLQGFADVVLWKLDAEGCAKEADMEPGDWERYICVEAPAALQPVQVPAGTS